MPIFRYNETAGNYYAYLIEGHGDDANDGLTPETAVATLDRLVEILDTYAGTSRRHAVIVKKRIYNEGISYARNASKPITFEFVGGCEIDGSGASYLQYQVLNDLFKNANIIEYENSFISTAYNNITYPYFENCKFNNVVFHSISLTIYASNTLFKNMTITTSGSNNGYSFVLNNCIIDNVTTPQASTYNSSHRTQFKLINSIIQNSLNLRISLTTFPSYVFDYNNIIGNIIFNGATKDNTAIQTDGYNLNGLSANPQFTDPTNGQYTVNQSSPCLYRGEGGDHIGIGEGFYLQANILYFQQSAINNFQLTTGLLGFIDPLDNAFIETNPIDIGQIITLEKAELAAILPTVAGEFTAGPVHYSHWYPAYSAASTYHKGSGVTDSAVLYRSLVDDNLNNTPASSATEWERLTWESGVSYAAGKIVQYTDDKWYKANTATSTSWVAGEWDEVVMIREWNLQVKTGRTYDEAVAADWATIPYNVTPLLDTAGKGNSDDAYNPATGAVMVFRFIAVRIDAKTIV